MICCDWSAEHFARHFLWPYGCDDGGCNYKPRRGRLRGSPFTSSVRSLWNVYGVHEFQLSYGTYETFTSSIWNIWNNHLICFTPLHSNVSNRVRTNQTVQNISSDISFDTVFDVVRIRLESGSNTFVHNPHLEHMKHPFDMFYSIAFEHFLFKCLLIIVN